MIKHAESPEGLCVSQGYKTEIWISEYNLDSMMKIHDIQSEEAIVVQYQKWILQIKTGKWNNYRASFQM